MTCVGCDRTFSQVRSELLLYARKFINDICKSQRNNLNKIIELSGIAIFQSKQQIIAIYSIFSPGVIRNMLSDRSTDHLLEEASIL